MRTTPLTQYATDRNLPARQRLWGHQRGGVQFVDWVLGLVEWGERPGDAGRVLIDDATVIADYLFSVADTYGPQVSQPWPGVVETVRWEVERIIHRDGHFVTSGDVGIIISA